MGYVDIRGWAVETYHDFLKIILFIEFCHHLICCIVIVLDVKTVNQ